MANLKKPLRMCIVCRGRFEKENLLQLQCKDKKLVSFTGNGRSFYLCEACLDENSESGRKKLEKSLFKECKNKDEYIVQLKEILTHVR